MTTEKEPSGGSGHFLSRMRRQCCPGPLERRLFLIVLVGLLPLALLSLATLAYNEHHQKQQIIEASEGTMRAIITAVDGEIKISLASLDALAASPRLEENDIKGFYGEAKELLQRHPNWANIVVVTSDAKQAMNTRLPFGAPLPAVADLDSIAETIRTGMPSVGNVVLGKGSKLFAFAIRVPVKHKGRIAYVLTAVIKPDSLHDLLLQQRIPEPGVVAIFDANYNIVARSLNHAEWLGKPASPDFLQVLKEDHPFGFLITHTLEGIPVYTLYRRSTMTGWTAAVGIPVSVLNKPFVESYAILGGAIVLSVMLGILAAYLVSRTIIRPMRQLELAASAVGKGKPPVIPDTALPEIRQTGSALATAYVEREKLLRSEREARVTAETASKAKDEFLAMLGHELRNPLSAISSASHILDRAQHGASPEMESNAKAVIRRQVNHLSRLTDDLLDAGRVIMGKIHLALEPVDLSAVAQNVVEGLRNNGQGSQHEFLVSLEPVWVTGDGMRMEQIVTNLLTNAVKYTPPPGSISISLTDENGVATLRVKDSGLGLETDLLPRVFDLFVQGNRSLDRSQGGLGIGLTLVRRLAELHSGSVEAKSEGPGQGSEFILRLPAIEAPDAPAPHAILSSQIKPRTIVIVEDNVDLRESLRSFLELWGHAVHEAGDGAAGVEMVLRENADVALVDIGLPVLDGYGVAREIRARANHSLRMIAMSGYGSEEDIREGKRAGFDAYLVKPVNLEELSALISEA